jgi:thiol-disulfide isomerase/thioredoxin
MKIMTTALLAILLTACGADDHTQEKKTETKTTQTQTQEKATTKATTTASTTTETKSPSAKTVQKTTPAEKPTTAAQPKPIFDLVDSDGKILHVDEIENGVIFQEHKGKVVFLLFFGHRCPPCLGEIPELIELQKEKGDKLAIIAVEVQGLPAEQLNAFKASKKINYTLLSDSTAQNSQFVSYIAQRALWRGSIPFLVGISPNGEVNFVHVGGMRKHSLEQVFEQLAQQK